MNFIVTGGLGHIGSHVIRHLLVDYPGSTVTIVDDLSSKRFCSMFNLPKNGKYRFIEGDVRAISPSQYFAGGDIVIHLAAITDAAGSFNNAELVERNNFEATEAIADACVRFDAKLLAPSSTSVYGTQKELVDENCGEEDLKPQSPYAETKLREESMLRDLSSKGDLRSISFRFGTIFGVSPGMRFHTAVNKFCWQAATGRPLTVWSTAFEQKRPYLSLDDAYRVMVFAIENKLFNGEIYNVLTGNYTVKQVVNLLQAFAKNIEIDFVDSEIMNQLSYEVSCQKILGLGFRFSGDIKDGIYRTLETLGALK